MRIKSIIITLVMLNIVFLCLAQEFAGGSGTEADPWQIATAEHLNNVRNYVGTDHSNKHFIQIANINLGVPPWNEGEGWVPIGNSLNNCFMGSYNAMYHIVSELTIRRNEPNQGLFGLILNCVIKKLGLTNLTIVSDSAQIGGLAGLASNAKVENCFVIGSIRGGQFSGGLVGIIYDTEINDCYTAGSVKAISPEFGTAVGGLIGLTSTDATIANCYSRMSVSGNRNYIGGLIGKVYSGEVTRSYSTGSITVTEPGAVYFGGLIGYVWTGSVINSYWDIQTSGQISSAGGTGAEGRTTMQMTYPYAVNTYDNWDFDGIWMGDSYGNANHGYPFLRWQIQPYPKNAVHPYPENDSVGVSVNLFALEWRYEKDLRNHNPVGFRVYFDTVDEFGDDDFFWVPYIEEQVEYRCADILPERLASGITYHWKVVPTTNEPSRIRAKSRGQRAWDSEQRKESKERRTEGIRQNDKTSQLDTHHSQLTSRGDAVNCPVWSFTTIDPTNVGAIHELPIRTELKSNHPNPFNPETTITYSLKNDTDNLQLIIYNVRGQVVRNLHEGYQEKGIHNIIWDGNDDSGNPIPSGIYLYRMKTDDYEQINKMTIIK